VYDLQVLSASDEVVYIHRLGERPCQVGRAPVNDLVINDARVSQFHGLLWVEGEKVHIRDLGSRNGTFQNGERVTGTVELAVNDIVSIGPDTRMRLTPTTDVHAGMTELVVQEVATGICFPIRDDRLHFGDSEECEVDIPDAGGRVASILLVGEDEIWLGEGTEDRPIELNQDFDIASRTYRVVRRESLFETTAMPTRQPASGRYPYRIIATLDGPTGPEATVQDPTRDLEYRVDAENRAVLLYLLARQWSQDAAQDEPSRGWCSNEELLTGVWGRAAQDDNKLHVLVYRLRNELKKVGFDPWFLEKRRRYTRLRLREAEVD
jgi:hypothetical protein